MHSVRHCLRQGCMTPLSRSGVDSLVTVKGIALVLAARAGDIDNARHVEDRICVFGNP